MHWYKFNIADWSLATLHLSLTEEAVYFRLLNHYYNTEQPIPLETQQVARRLRLHDQLEIVVKVLAEFFTQTENGFEHKRCERELKEYRKQAKKSRDNGSRGGRPLKNKGLSKTQQEPRNNLAGSQQEPSSNPNITLTTNQEPLTTNYQPETKNQEPILTASAGAAPSLRRAIPKGEHTWVAYSSAYEGRYGVVPVRNAKVNAQLVQIVDRLGAEDAPQVAAFFVHHNASWYVAKGHPVGALLADAEKLRTEWATGRKVTGIQARQVEKTQANLDSHNEALAILRAKGLAT